MTMNGCGQQRAALARFESGRFLPSIRMAQWTDFMRQRILGVSILADTKETFSAEARLIDLGDVSITRYELSPQVMVRNGRAIDDGDSGFTFSLVESGKILAKRNGTIEPVQPMSALMLPAGANSAFHFPEHTVFWGIKLRGEALSHFRDYPHRMPPTGTMLAGRSVAMILAYCQLIEQSPAKARPEAHAIISAHILDFIGSMDERATSGNWQ